MSATVSTTRSPSKSRIAIVCCVAVIAMSIAVLSRPHSVAQPTRIATRAVAPTAIRRYRGQWYWIEAAGDKGAQLVRAAGATVAPIATADAIDGFALDNDLIVWTERHGARWQVQSAPLSGGAPISLWSGEAEPLGVAAAGGAVYWLQRVPPMVRDADPFPPLAATLELRTAAGRGGNTRTVGRLWEAEDGVVLGARPEGVYVAAYRHIQPGSMCLYRMPLDGTPAVRVAGASGNPSALLTREGRLYWLAPSRETAMAHCLQRLDQQGRVESLSDWLPDTGTLYDTDRGVACVDRFPGARVWFGGPPDRFPIPLTVPTDFRVLAAGEHELLLEHSEGVPSRHALYGMPLP